MEKSSRGGFKIQVGYELRKTFLKQTQGRIGQPRLQCAKRMRK